jgi:hypothetical protein
MRIVVAIALLLHGLITALQSKGNFTLTEGTPDPPWLHWWPVSLGKSWILPIFGLEKPPISFFFGVLWLVAGSFLVSASLGLFGFLIPSAWWRLLAGIGAVLSLVIFIFYAHPLFIVGISANLAILLVLLLLKWPSPEVLGS